MFIVLHFMHGGGGVIMISAWLQDCAKQYLTGGGEFNNLGLLFEDSTQKNVPKCKKFDLKCWRCGEGRGGGDQRYFQTFFKLNFSKNSKIFLKVPAFRAALGKLGPLS
jgi:hypothetical protein